MQGYVIKKNDPERCPVLIGDTQDLGKCENAVPDTIKKCEGGTPNIRFQGFSDDWEQRKLGDLCDITTGKLDANAMVQDGQFDFYTSGVDVYKIDRAAFEGPAITIAGNGASVGYMHLADGKFNAYQRTYVLTGFLADRQFLNVAIGNELPAKIQEEVRGSGIPYIVLDMLTELNIPFPSHNEQQQIGSYFRNLDSLINLHQRKCDETKELKKYMLQKMFPKDGEKVPEIRFQGFTDDWEQRKLGDITESYSGGTPTAGKKEYYDGNIPFIRSGEISSDKTELFISNEGLNSSSAKMVEKGDILYALYGATSGEVSISKLKGAINQAVLAIQPHQNYDSQFLMQWLRKSKYNIIGTYLQGGQGNLSGSIVKELIIDVPTYEEQKQIGEYFSNLDNLITLHQRKCNELKEIKQYMLQNMFP